ncbi:hypothetical protein FPQ18DRAFT_306515 [Pyronema domesticum]|uniref:Uncharacterized protein n=1 Tax=Pyronema omphalodes (strain CBS 100304) TaxID=1076935 RepID=U4L275_PYROM|nr:hypothetical protein FPQ18DRAFT_306515 [Pyronema domesticum]CCX09761.1 Protein of unknown function [Pyronema omphalodes CBS 100304]
MPYQPYFIRLLVQKFLIYRDNLKAQEALSQHHHSSAEILAPNTDRVQLAQYLFHRILETRHPASPTSPVSPASSQDPDPETLAPQDPIVRHTILLDDSATMFENHIWQCLSLETIETSPGDVTMIGVHCVRYPHLHFLKGIRFEPIETGEGVEYTFEYVSDDLTPILQRVFWVYQRSRTLEKELEQAETDEAVEDAGVAIGASNSVEFDPVESEDLQDPEPEVYPYVSVWDTSLPLIHSLEGSFNALRRVTPNNNLKFYIYTDGLGSSLVGLLEGITKLDERFDQFQPQGIATEAEVHISICAAGDNSRASEMKYLRLRSRLWVYRNREQRWKHFKVTLRMGFCPTN